MSWLYKISRPPNGQTHGWALPLALCALVLGFSVFPAPATASKESKVLAARGLVEFNAERYSDALDLFNQAVAADPADLSSVYYRAATLARLGDYEAAVEDLRKVVAERPDLNQAVLDLGVALVELKQFEEAIPWLEKAQQSPETEANSSMFLGLAQLRLGRNSDAATNFRRAAEDPELTVAAHYYLGIVAYRRNERVEAEEHFAFVIQNSPRSAVGREAQTFLEKLGSTQGRRYHLYAGTGFQFDSNVILAPTGGAGDAQDVLGVSGKSDGRSVINLGGNYIPWRNQNLGLSLGYDFFQSLHFNLNEFNLQDHGPSVQIFGNAGRVRMGLLGRYDYYLLQDQSFLQQVGASPWVTIDEGSFGRSDVYYGMRRRDYKKRTFAIRNGFNHAVGVQQLFFLGSAERYASIRYGFDLEDPVVDDDLVDDGVFSKDAAESFAYRGHEIGVGLGMILPLELDTELRYSYRYRNYASESSDFTPSGNRRYDNEHYVLVAVTKPFMGWFEVTAAFLADIAGSNDPRFEYDRYIGSLTVQVEY